MSNNNSTDDLKKSIKAQWYNESLMGRVANRLKEIVSPRGEKIYLLYNPDTMTYQDEIEYKGRRLSVWAIYPYSEVGDFDIGEPVYYTRLADIILCPDFKQAIEKVQEEESIVIHNNGGIDLNDCLLIAGHSLIDYEGIAERLHLENEVDHYHFWRKVCDDLSVFLNPEFKIFYSFDSTTRDEKLYFRDVYGIRQQDIIDCSPMFREKMQKVTEYLSEKEF